MILNEFTQYKNEISKKIEQISKQSVAEAPKVDLQEPTFQFLIEKNKQEQEYLVE